MRAIEGYGLLARREAGRKMTAFRPPPTGIAGMDLVLFGIRISRLGITNKIPKMILIRTARQVRIGMPP